MMRVGVLDGGVEITDKPPAALRKKLFIERVNR